jgi:LacI family transcriptional regulator
LKKNKVTFKEIASEIGVSQSTISRALSGHPAISEETRLRTLQAARRLNYQERGVARAEPPTRMIGVVVAALHNQFYVHLLDHLHDELRAYGYNMTLIIDSLSEKEDFSAFEPLVHQFLDGIVLTTASVDWPLTEKLKQTGIPTVLAVRAIDELPFDTVEVDNEVAGQEAARHLFDLGHRRIGFIMGPKNTSTSRDRYRGGVEWLRRNGVKLDDTLTRWGAFTHASGYSSLLSLLALPEPPTAVICGNDTIAIGVLEAARKRGIDVPHKLSVIGFDDIPIAGWEMIQLTTIRQPIAEMAAMAARRIVERIRGDAAMPPRHDRLPVNLVQRNSTARVSAPWSTNRIIADVQQT